MKKRSIKRQKGYYLRCQIKTLKHSGKSPFAFSMLLYAEGEGNAWLFQGFLARIVRSVKGHLGAFHSTQNSGNFGWYIHLVILVGRTEMALPWVPEVFSRVRQGASFRGWFPNPETAHEKPLAPRVKWPFPFDKIVVPSTALLYPAYKNNNQTLGGSGRVCATGMYRSIGHVTFPKFQTGIFVEWNAPPVTVERCPDLAACLARIVARRPLKLN